MAKTTGSDERQRTFWDERFRKHWGLEGASTVHFGRQFNRWRYRVRRRVFRRVVRSLALESGTPSVLDVGVGVGFYLRLWQELGVSSLSGLDISDHVVDRLSRAYPNAALYRADISGASVPSPVQAFDVVTAIDVLTHVLDDDAYLRALRNIHRCLKPGGYLLYTDTFFHGPDKQSGEYWRGRTLAVAAEAMDASGFEIVSRVPFSVLMSAPTDTRHRERAERIWDLLMLPVLRSEWAGFLYGLFLFPIELLLVSVLRESPGIEVMVCRKRS